MRNLVKSRLLRTVAKFPLAKNHRDNANFINFCVSSGQDLTNGEQKTGGSCNGIPMVFLS